MMISTSSHNQRFDSLLHNHLLVQYACVSWRMVDLCQFSKQTRVEEEESSYDVGGKGHLRPLRTAAGQQSLSLSLSHRHAKE